MHMRNCCSRLQLCSSPANRLPRPTADVLFSTDGCGTQNSAGDTGLEIGGNMHHNFNTGGRGVALGRAFHGASGATSMGNAQPALSKHACLSSSAYWYEGIVRPAANCAASSYL